MKREYNPYPHNNERCGTLQYEDYEIYEYNFYNSKEFHEKRMVRGAKLISEAKSKTVLLGALTGLCACGAVVLGVNAVNASSISNIILNLSGLSVLAGTGFTLVKDGILPKIEFIQNANKDMEVSKQMIKRLSKTNERS